MIVVDTNVLAYHLSRGPHHEAAKAAYRKDPEWSAPRICRSEIVNILARRVRRGEESISDALLLLRGALEILAGREFPADPATVLGTAVESGCTAYDCEFVVLARNLAVPLVTADEQILRAFPWVAVSLEDFARKGG